MNRLSQAKSAYLKHSAHQRIDWYPWCEDAFDRAKKEDKPVFLSSGAIWCHWCHVMAKECFEDEEIVDILNKDFICIKLDRDERPDIDRRYQIAVQLMTGTGGWPLTVFMTPDKKPFFGGTYFPPEDSFGRPGFKKVLWVVADFYRNHKDEIAGYTERLLSVLKQERKLKVNISEDLIAKGIESVISSYDPQNGGFGSAPKFPHSGAIEFLINRYYFTRDEAIRDVVKNTLVSMAKGGIYDQIGGGFHRYSTDEAWIIPHFEKMADDNAWLLRNYLDAYAVSGDEYFKDVAEGIIRFIDQVLSDKDGCFYASQDADVSPDDEGGYFTWREKEIKDILNPEELEVISLHLLDDRGRMHYDPSKHVLFISKEISEIARILNRDEGFIKETVKRAKEKMLNHRNTRESPFVDKNIYTSLNGMLISSYIKAYRILRDERLKDFAIRSIDRLIRIRFNGDEFYHSDGVMAMLDDYVHLVDALICSYEITGNNHYLNMAIKVMDMCIQRMWNEDGGAFFDSESSVLDIRLQGIEDIPHPSGNSLSIITLLKLFQLTDRSEYLKYAERSLESFASAALNLGIIGAYYYNSLDCYYRMMRLSAYGEGNLIDSALFSFRPYTIIRYSVPYGLPGIYKERQYIVPCLKTGCYDAIYREDELKEFLNRH